MTGGLDGRREAEAHQRRATTVPTCGAEVCPQQKLADSISSATQSDNPVECKAGKLAKDLMDLVDCSGPIDVDQPPAESGCSFGASVRCGNPNVNIAQTILTHTQLALEKPTSAT